MPYVSYEQQSRQLEFSSFIKEVHEETKISLSTRHQGFAGYADLSDKLLSFLANEKLKCEQRGDLGLIG